MIEKNSKKNDRAIRKISKITYTFSTRRDPLYYLRKEKKKIYTVITRPRNRAREKIFQERRGNNRVSFHDKSRLPKLACNYRLKR